MEENKTHQLSDARLIRSENAPFSGVEEGGRGIRERLKNAAQVFALTAFTICVPYVSLFIIFWWLERGAWRAQKLLEKESRFQRFPNTPNTKVDTLPRGA